MEIMDVRNLATMDPELERLSHPSRVEKRLDDSG